MGSYEVGDHVVFIGEESNGYLARMLNYTLRSMNIGEISTFRIMYDLEGKNQAFTEDSKTVGLKSHFI